MAMDKKKRDWSLHEHYAQRVRAQVKSSPWMLRITEHSDKPVPIFMIKERIVPNGNEKAESTSSGPVKLEQRGLVYGPALRRCLPVFRKIVGTVTDEQGVPLELHRFLTGNSIDFRGNLPLDEEAGFKLALIFKLRERIQDMDRVELIARRVGRFTREEAAYWFSRITNFGEDPNRWARSGMRTMLGGQPGDPAVQEMLERLRNTY